jgi:hypothetical protein
MNKIYPVISISLSLIICNMKTKIKEDVKKTQIREKFKPFDLYSINKFYSGDYSSVKEAKRTNEHTYNN